MTGPYSQPISGNGTPPGCIRSWLTLIRLPNLLTVPGDPVAGALLAASALPAKPSWGAILSLAGSALLLYAAGLISNDYFDRATDARERPHRPLPSGAVRPAYALMASLLLTLSGLCLAFRAGWLPLSIAVMLTVMISFYNITGKHFAWIGPVAMGLCRGLSLAMGAATSGLAGLITLPVLYSVLGLAVFIALVTVLARHEAKENHAPASWPQWGIPASLLTWISAVVMLAPPPWSRLALVLATMTVAWSLVWMLSLKRSHSPATVQAAIGGLIRGLLLTQAALCALSGQAGEAVALVLVLAFPLAGWLGKWFYGS